MLITPEMALEFKQRREAVLLEVASGIYDMVDGDDHYQYARGLNDVYALIQKMMVDGE